MPEPAFWMSNSTVIPAQSTSQPAKTEGPGNGGAAAISSRRGSLFPTNSETGYRPGHIGALEGYSLLVEDGMMG